jgi:DNA-binding MarR family transcriptional regulator
MYQETSMLSFDSIQEELGDKQKLVLWAFRSQGDKTNAEMASFLSWPINCITPRVGELVKMGFVEAKGLKMGATNRRAIVWGVK